LSGHAPIPKHPNIKIRIRREKRFVQTNLFSRPIHSILPNDFFLFYLFLLHFLLLFSFFLHPPFL